MKKPSILLDISLLGHPKGIRRGMERMAGHLFDALLESGEYELSFAATSHLAGAYDFLLEKGLSPEKVLRYSPAQLRKSRIGHRLSNLVHRTMKNRGLPLRAARRILSEAARICNAGESRLTPSLMQNADIYHSMHHPFPAAVKQAAGLKRFITVHDFNPLKFPDYYSKKDGVYMRDLLASLTTDSYAFCYSEVVRDDILNLAKTPPEHIFVTPLAADGNIFHKVTDISAITAVRRKYGIPEGNYLLSLSAQVPHKNFALLVRCFGALVEAGKLKGTNLVVVGLNRERYSDVAAALAKYPEAQSRMVTTGYAPDEDLAAIYSGAAAFLFPSLCEGFGMPPLEAMQCGLPVIASNATSIPEVVGDAGVLLPPTDEDAWSQAMVKIAGSQDWRSELSERSLRRSKMFSWQRFMEETCLGYNASLR